MAAPKLAWHGKSTKGINPGFLAKVSAAASAAGATYVYVISGKRTPATNTGVKNSNHLSGHAMDGYAYVPGRGKIPLGTLLKATAGSYGLRSGDQAGFYPAGPWANGTDPNHVDDGYNVRGGKPLQPTQAVPQTGDAAQPAADPAASAEQSATMSQQLASNISQIPQVGGAPLARAPLAGDYVDTTLAPQQSAASSWQLIASTGNVSPETLRLAQLAGYGGNATSG